MLMGSAKPAINTTKKRAGVSGARTQELTQQTGNSQPRILLPLAAMAVLSALTALTYANSISNGLVWDDNQQIVMNPDLRPDVPVARLFRGDVWSFRSEGGHNYYRPLQMLTYRLIAATWGYDAKAFHIASIVFHLLVVILAFFLFWRLCARLDLALAAAALFAVHPIHTEAVDWISALPELGCTVFLLLAFLLFHIANFTQSTSSSPARSRFLRFALATLSCLTFATALLWKETAIVFPLLVMAYPLCLGSEGLAGRWRLSLSLPYWLILAGYFLLRFRLLGLIATRQRNWTLSAWQVTLTLINLLAAYWEKLFVPFRLNAYHVFSPVRSLADARVLAAIAFVVLASTAIVSGIRRAKLAAFATLWVFLALVPALDIYAVGRNVFAERYLYLSSVAFCLLIVLAGVYVARWIPENLRRGSLVLGLLVVVLAFSFETVSRNPDWKDNSTLFARTLEFSPNAPFVQNMVAESYRTGVDIISSVNAETHFQQAISLAEKESPPDLRQVAFAYGGLAEIYADRSDWDGALSLLEQAREANPSDPELDGQQGLILVRAGRWAEAEQSLQKAATANPNNENVLNALGLIEWQHNHKLNEAEHYFTRALEIHVAQDNFSASLHNNLGALYGEKGKLVDAIAQLKLAVAAAPRDPEYHTNLAQGYVYLGQKELARAEAENALELAPGYQPAREVLRELRLH